MTEKEREPTREEKEFQEKHKAAWDEIRGFLQSAESDEEYYGERNPQHRFAPEFFQIYLDKRPETIAQKALRSAFMMWGNLRGVSERVNEAVEYIPYEDDVWVDLGHSIIRAYQNDDRDEEGFELVERLSQRVVPLQSRTDLLAELAGRLKNGEEFEEARKLYEQIIAWNASERHVEQARGHIYEFDNLNIGQPAPHFRIPDIDGQPVDLADCLGRVVVLHFWGTDCGWCQFIYPPLRKIAQEYPGEKVALIGVSEDTDLDVLRSRVKEEEFTWPQICEGKGWQDTVFKLFNVGGIPAEYVLDREGKIAAKLHGGGEGSGEELEDAVRCCVDA